MKQRVIRFTACAALFASSNGAVFGADKVPKLPGTAQPFAGAAWGSSPDDVKTAVGKRGFVYAQTDDDGDLIFSEVKNGTTTHLFEVFDRSQKLVKALVDIPHSSTDPIAIFDALSKTMVEKLGKPSASFDDYMGPYRSATTSAEKQSAIAAGKGTLAMFWMYQDGSSISIEVSSKLEVETAFESASMKAQPAAPAASAGSPAFTGPAAWAHTGTSDGLGTWRRSSDTGYVQTITVVSKNGFASLDELLQAETNYVSSLPDRFGYAPTDTTVCGNHPAKYLSYTWTSADGTPVTTEEIIAVFGTTGYSARYNKSITQYADQSAEHALSTICGHEGAK